MKKAFDTIDHTLLLKILENVGLIQLYLSNRIQRVKIENILNNPLIINDGI